MKPVLLMLFLAALFRPALAQTNGNLEIEKGFGGTRIYQDDMLLKPKQVLKIMESNPEAYAEFKRAKSSNGAAQVFGLIGGFLIGWPIGTALAGGEPQWGMAIAGGGILLLSIPCSLSFNKHATKAVELYNNGSGPSGRLPVKFSVGAYSGGVSVVMRF